MPPPRHSATRRDFVTASAAAAVTLLHQRRLLAAEADPRLAEVLARTIAIDMHSHVGIPFNKPNAPLPRFDLVGEMKRTGFVAVIQTYEVDSVPAAPGQDYHHNVEALDFEDRLLTAAKVPRALTLKDIEDAHARQQPVVIQAAEGAQFLEGRIERVEEVYKRGMRLLTPVHDRDPLSGAIADTYTRAAQYGGLTAFGAQVIKECNRLGMVIDCTHMSYDAVKAVLKISAHPVLFSHTSLQPGPGDKPAIPMLAPRLLGGDEIREIAARGGVIGVWCHGSDTAREYVEMIKRVVDVAGIDHVGIGTDSDLEPNGQRTYTNAIWKGEARGFFPAVAAEMLAAGFSPDEVAKLGGGNFCRVFGQVTAART